MIDLSLVMPDGQEFAYGPVPDGTQPVVGDVIAFTRSDRGNDLAPDEVGLEDRPWKVLGREWVVRTRGGVGPLPARVTFLVLRLGEWIG